MSKFWQGFLIGVISLAAVLAGFKLTKSEDGAINRDDSLSPIDHEERIAAPAIPATDAHVLTESNSLSNHRAPIIKSDIPVDSAPLDNNVNELDFDNSSDGEGIKSRIHRAIDQYSENDLAVVAHFIEHLHDKPASALYLTEPIDTVWALQKQVDLEYGFYTDSPLREIGKLESIACRSQYCRVNVQVPAGFELKYAHYMDWAEAVEIKLKPTQDDINNQTVEFYIARSP